jgi:hypothetical protein
MSDARDSFQFKCKQVAGQSVQNSILSGKKVPEIFPDTSKSYFQILPPATRFRFWGGVVFHLESVTLKNKIQTQKASEFARQTHGKRQKQLLMFSWSSLARSV